METNEQPRVRYRVNVTRLAKGNFTFDCTVEVEGPVPAVIDFDGWRLRCLVESAKLVAALEAKYPREAAPE